MEGQLAIFNHVGLAQCIFWGAWLLYPKALIVEQSGTWVGSWDMEVYEKLAESLMNGFQVFPGIHIQYATFLLKNE